MKNAKLKYFQNLFSKYNQTIRFVLFRNCVKCFLGCVWIFNQNAVSEVFAGFSIVSVASCTAIVVAVVVVVPLVVAIKH